MRESVLAGAALIAAFVVAAFSIQSAQPPAVGESTEAGDFSTGRAMTHVRELASRPRPLGSDAHADARQYIVARLEALGLATELQEETVTRTLAPGVVLAGRVTNVLARLPGSRPSPGRRDRTAGTPRGGAVALLAHYDSRPQTWGGADDASGVAIVLESMRTLVADPTSRDVIAIITDGEEIGLLGANAFVENHRWLTDLDFVLNVEARGNRGSSMMFETTTGNLPLMSAYAKAAPFPFAHSLSHEVYRRMPNDSDFSVFRRAGVAGLNFAFIGNHPAYHTRLDSAGAIDQRSLWHQGSNVAAVTRALANLEDLPAARPDAVYFPLPGWKIVVYPTATARTLALALGLLAATALWRTRNAGVWTTGGLIRGALLVFAASIGGFVIASVTWEVLQIVGPRLLEAPHGRPYRTWSFGAAAAFVILGFVATLCSRLVPTGRRLAVLAGSLLVWTLACLGLAFVMPGASYLLCWPAVGGWVAWWIVGRAGGEESSSALHLVTMAGALPGLVLFAPVLPIFLEALTLSGAGAPASLFGLLLTLLSPQLAVLGRRSGVALGFAGVGLAIFIAAFALSDANAARPNVDSLLYFADESGDSWMSFDNAPDEWTEIFLGADPEVEPAPRALAVGGRSLLRNSAPRLEPGRPLIELTSGAEEGARVRSLLVAPGIGGQALRLRAWSASPIEAVYLDGERFEVGESAGESRLILLGGTSARWSLGFELEGSAPLEVEVVEQRYGLPGSQVLRPPHLMPSSSWRTDSTFVSRRVTVE